MYIDIGQHEAVFFSHCFLAAELFVSKLSTLLRIGRNVIVKVLMRRDAVMPAPKCLSL